ncbi:hypothetical protein AURDEDRAFT_182316 [Auricularia subglabra TFB-10046 SS5]|nr:hypothetical protein AURDEDRAFT_182316 [Auricularia subglabra TFB-10046 SS5]
MTRARLLARAQLGLNIAALESLDERRAALKAALSDARSALERAEASTSALRSAQADIDVLQPELAAAGRLRDVLLPEIQRQRRYFARTLLDSAFPPELLSAIFLEVIAGPDKEWEESIIKDGTYNSARNRAPHILATVCSRWRLIAMGLSGLWTYIGVPHLGRPCRTHDLYLCRVEKLLTMSKNHPLDVMLDWQKQKRRVASRCKHYQLILDAVSRHMGRWRRVQLTLPDNVAREHLNLYDPAPLLVDFSIVPSDPDDRMLPCLPQSRHLPVCPKLHMLCACKVFVLPQHPLPFLRDLYIRIDDTPIDVVWQLLRLCPTVESLSLLHNEEVTPETPAAFLSLPTLVNLGLAGNCDLLLGVLTSITMPALESLQIFTYMILYLGDLPGTIVDKVSTLWIVGETTDEVPLDAEAAAGISLLGNVEVFKLSEYSDNSAVGLFATLAEGDAIWPKLGWVQIHDCTLREDSGEAFLEFIISRRKSRDSASLSPFRVTLVDSAIPSWLEDEIRTHFGDMAILNSNTWSDADT